MIHGRELIQPMISNAPNRDCDSLSGSRYRADRWSPRSVRALRELTMSCQPQHDGRPHENEYAPQGDHERLVDRRHSWQQTPTEARESHHEGGASDCLEQKPSPAHSAEATRL